MISLLVAEKPKVAKRIADALGSYQTRQSHQVTNYKIETDQGELIIAPAAGHIFSLDHTEEGWDYPVFNLEWVPAFETGNGAKFTKKYYKNLKEQGEKADLFINGCDFDPEGSVIGRNCIKYACQGSEERIKRMKFSTLTRSDLRDAFDNLEDYDRGQTEAGVTRHFLDYYHGVNLSRALIKSVKANDRYQTLSIGRVQGPALKILAEKELKIRKFEPEPYWQLKATLTGDKGKIKALHKKKRFKSEAKANKIKDRCQESSATVSQAKKKAYKTGPFPPFNLGDLQSEAYSAFGFSPSRTLKLAQNLYSEGYISYPRTDSQKIPAKVGYKKILGKIKRQRKYKELVEEILDQDKLKPKQGKKSDPAHPCIYPTGNKPKQAGKDDKKVYDLIVRRFVSCFGRPAIRAKLSLAFNIKEEIYKAKGQWTTQKNWMRFYEPYLRYKENKIPQYQEEETLQVKKVKKLEKETKPPKRYTQSSLVKKLESKSLGTKATRASIVKKLYKRDYIEGKSIRVTDLGLAVINTLEKHCPEIISEELTRKFEREMEEIREGDEKRESVLTTAQDKLEEILDKIKAEEKEIGSELIEAIDETRRKKKEVGTCSECGGTLRIIRSKKTGKRFVGCSGYDDGCRNSYPLPQSGKIVTTDEKCKACGKPIVKVIRKGKRPWRLCINPDCPKKSDSDSNSD